MTLRAGLFMIVLIAFFIGIWSVEYSMQGYIIFGFLGITGALNVLRYGISNKEIAKN
ncbi:MAG TPA: hypothetical protein VK097_12840 [Lentibacillus sp.]|uniref:hypothetical protein n=1 Tax=Lentibacillus sp. TaxID=1925746 RepID=UPI002B4B5524|nr:hypothetical protein [Lentibacillus sp.]HLR63311.1 hypothetical protein [Lentibacillus sp.]